MKLPPKSHIGSVGLNVADLERMTAFYAGGVGLEPLSTGDDAAVLGSRGTPLIELVTRPDLPPAGKGSAGLYHTAVLFEERSALAAALYATATSGAGSFTGSADHLVSLAFYFNDPEGNGVELYWDRPREEWQWTEGEVAMDSLPLDPNRFIAEFREGAGELAAPRGADASIGHVHLKVGDIPRARAFYVDTLGLDVTMGGWPSALFTSAGGYHHHVGMNIWESRGAEPRTPSLGLESFEIVVPVVSAIEELKERLERSGIGLEDDLSDRSAVSFRDPWNTLVKVKSA